MKILTTDEVKRLRLDQVSVITADMLEGYNVIEEWAFRNCETLISITIPNSVTSIGKSAFCGSSSLKTITIGNSVTSIGNESFAYCSSLTSVTIPNSVTSIGEWAFYNCSSLTSVTIPDSVTSIGECAFGACTGLTSVTIPNSVTSIGEWAFYNCSSLTSVTIPDSVTSIGERAFGACTGLTSIDVASDNSNYCSVDGVLFNKDKTTLIQYPGGKQGAYTIPNNVTSIGDYAFCYCSSLSSVTIPNSVTTIGGHAFYNCSSLTSVTIPNSVTSIREYAFRDCSSLTTVTIGDKTYERHEIVDGKCKAYKGFKPDLTCRDYQYKEGETFIMDGPIAICIRGFHACINLKDVFNYYSGEIGKGFVIHEVDLENVKTQSDYFISNDSKVVGGKITIGKRIL